MLEHLFANAALPLGSAVLSNLVIIHISCFTCSCKVGTIAYLPPIPPPPRKTCIFNIVSPGYVFLALLCYFPIAKFCLKVFVSCLTVMSLCWERQCGCLQPFSESSLEDLFSTYAPCSTWITKLHCTSQKVFALRPKGISFENGGASDSVG